MFEDIKAGTEAIPPEPAGVSVDNGGTEEVFVLPASLGQERFWALDRMNPGNPTWSVPVRFRLQGPLDPALLERAFNRIIQRHEVLRTTFTVVDERPAQVVKSALEISVPVVDLRHLAKPERDAEVDRLSFNEARWRFDLAAGPLFRVTLLRIEDNEHVMLVTPHHSVIDYLSIGLIASELGVIYEAYSRNLEPVLSDLPIQYGDYAVWQREQAESPALQKELAYWKDQLRDLPLLDFPTDRPRPASPSFEATITSILLPVSLTDGIRQIGNRESATFFNTVLAALGVLMHQHTGQCDFGAATQIAGRNSVELEPVIGPFINTVVLRLDLSGDPTFPQLLQRVQEVGLQSIANQNVRYEQVLKELRPSEYPSHHTLFRLNFICQRDPVRPVEFAGIKLTVIPSKSQGALYDLHVFLVLRNEGWRLACEYNTDLYEANTVTRLLGDFKGLLETIVQEPNRPISALPLSEGAIESRKKRAAAEEASGSRSASARGPRSLGAAAAAVAPAASAEAPTMAAGLAESEVRELRSHVAETDDEASGEAEDLAETENSAEAKDSAEDAPSFGLPASVAQRRFFALEEIFPGNPALHMRACVRLVGEISVPLLLESLRLLVERHESLRTTFQKEDEEVVQVIQPVAAVAHQIALPVTALEASNIDPETSGEKGLYAAIRAEVSLPFDLLHGPLLRARLFQLDPGEHVLVLTTHHVIVDGFSQNVIQRDLWGIYEALSKSETPSLLPLPIQYGDFAHWQQEWLQSEAAAEEIDFWKKELKAPLPALNLPTDRPPKNRPASRGAMETMLLPTDLTQALKELGNAEGATVFMVLLAGYAALLCRYAGQDEIIIGSPVANRKPETESLVGPFASPITLRLNLSGDPMLSEVLTRVRDVTLEALNHSELPFEVLMDHLEVRSVNGRNPLSQCYFFYQLAFLRPRELANLTITPLPDLGLGTHFELQMGMLDRREGLRAQLEYNPDLFDASTIRQLLESYREVLELMRDVPEARIHELKVLRPAQLAPANEPTAVEVEPRRAANATERKLQKIWESLLGSGPVGLNQNYFDLGGTSILAVRLFAQISREFERKIPLSALFEAPTVAQLAKLLTAEAPSGWSPLVPIQSEGSRPPFFCIHGGGGNVLIYRDLSRHLGNGQPFYGLQAQGLDGGLPILRSIEEMAALYVKEIRRFQPRGPYYLGGYCMGGTVAYEMAQQLRAQNEEVAVLAFFDTMNWCNVPLDTAARKLRHLGQRVSFHAQNFLLLDAAEKKKFFSEKVKVLRSRSQIWKGILRGKFRAKESAASSESDLLAEMWQVNDRACVQYKAKPYNGVVTDFRPMRQYRKYGPAEGDWSRLALGGYELFTLPVYPAGMLLEPFVRHIADALKVTISRSISRNASNSSR